MPNTRDLPPRSMHGQPASRSSNQSVPSQQSAEVSSSRQGSSFSLPSASRHSYDNSAPILAGAHGEDVLFESLQPSKGGRIGNVQALVRKQIVQDWGCVLHAIKQSPPSPMTYGSKLNTFIDTRKWITRSAQEFLLLSPEERATHLDATIRIVNAAGPFGKGLKAVRPIKAFEVLGAYAGKLLSGEELAQEQERWGPNVDVYLFRTGEEGRVVSGYQHGNALSVINEGDRPEQNNVGFIRLGRDVNFYVALRSIAKDESLFADYGSFYDRSLLVASAVEASHPGSTLIAQAHGQIGQQPGLSAGRCNRLASALATSAEAKGMERIDIVVWEGRALKGVQYGADPRADFVDTVAEIDIERALKTPLTPAFFQYLLGSGTERGELVPSTTDMADTAVGPAMTR